MQVSYISRHTWIQKADSSVSETQVPHIPQQTDTKQTDMDPIRPTWECPKTFGIMYSRTDKQTDRDADKPTPVCPSDRQTYRQTCVKRSRLTCVAHNRQTYLCGDKPTCVCPSDRQTDQQTDRQV